MLSWLKRLLGGGRVGSRRSRQTPPGAGDVGAVPPSVSGGESGTGSQWPATVQAGPPTEAPADEPPAAVAVRLPLLGPDGRIAGFEFRLPDAMRDRLQGRVDARAAARFSALLASTHVTLKAGRQALVALPAALLDRPAVARLAAPGVMLLLLDAANGPDDVALGRLRARGVRMGLPDGPPGLASSADFVVLQGGPGGTETLMLSAQRWREARPRLPMMATGLSHLDEIEQVLRAGFSLVGGRMDRALPSVRSQTLQPAAHRLAGLLNHLAMDRDTATVADAVRADATLSYRLLRYANSAAIGAPRAVETIDDAVQLLGRNELRRWLELMLLSTADARQAAPALQESTLARGRLLEALARRSGVDQPGVLFTLGLMSRLDVLLQMPLAAVVEPLRLSEDLQQALLHRRGPWSAYLAVADVLEGDDEAELGRLAEPFGGVEVVLKEAELAWRWAAEVTGSLRPD
jgi:c-di-GMP phosphodiesterase